MSIKAIIPKIAGIEVTPSNWAEFESAGGKVPEEALEIEHEDFAPTVMYAPGMENLIFSDPDDYS